MNIIDAIIILIILACALAGLKRGFTKALVSFLGFFVIIILAFILKNPISILLYENLPFFSFGGLFKGVTALNIIVYEVIAFFIVEFVLSIIFKILTRLTSIFEKFLKATIILGIPSKILGGIVGIVEGITWAFIVVYIASLPLFNFKEVNDSSLANLVIKHTPVLSMFTNDFTKTIEDFSLLKEEYEVKGNTQEFNYETMNILLKYDIVSVKSVKKLEEQGKLKIDNLDKLINEYSKGE